MLKKDSRVAIKLFLLIAALALIAGCSFVARQMDDLFLLEKHLGIMPSDVYRFDKTPSLDF